MLYSTSIEVLTMFLQRQETPPRLKKPRQSKNIDEDDNEENNTRVDRSKRYNTSSSTTRSPPHTAEKNSNSKGKKRKTNSPVPSTSSEPDNDSDNLPRSKSGKVSKGLGAIGGGAKNKKTPSPVRTEESTDTDASSDGYAKAKKSGPELSDGKEKKQTSRSRSSFSTESDKSKEQAGSTKKPKAVANISGQKIEKEKRQPDERESLNTSDGAQANKVPASHEESTGSDEEEQSVFHRKSENQTKRGGRSGQETKQKLNRGGLGQIGGKKKEKAKQSETSSGEQDDEDTITKPQIPERTRSSSQTPTRSNQTGKIGMIGGGKSQKKHDRPEDGKMSKPTVPGIPEEESTAESDNAPLDRDSSKSKTHRGPSSALEKANNDPPCEPSTKTKKDEEQQKKRDETPEERANRKREELRKQLEAKSQGPAKKKRRF